MDKKENKEVTPKKEIPKLTSVIKEDPSENMKVYVLLAIAAVLMIVIVGIIQYNKNNNVSSINDTLINDTLNDDVAKLATCLTEKGFRMYGSATCGACASQKALFGEDFDKVDYVECLQNAPNSRTEECILAGLVAVPTWEANGVLLDPGVITLEDLKEEADC